MRVLICTEEPATIWWEQLRQLGHTATVARPVAPLVASADLCLAVVADPVRARFWLATLTLPLLLVTPALAQADALGPHLPTLRLVSHPARAVQALGDLLVLADAVARGRGAAPPVLAALPTRWEGRDGWN